MSRYGDDRFDDRRTNVSRRRYDDDDDDYGPQPRYEGPPPSRRPPAAETLVRERDAGTVISQGRRSERPGPRQPDFLREDYGRNPNAGPLVVREDRREDDYVSRAPTRRRSLESVRTRGPPAPPGRVEKDEFVFRERDGESKGPPYPRSERGGYDEKDEFTFSRETRSRPPPSNRGGYDEKTEIRFKEDERSEWMPPRKDYKERDVEEIKFRRGGGVRPSPPPSAPAAPPPRADTDRQEFAFTRREQSRERSRAPPPRNEEREEITFIHRERSRERSRAPPPRSTYERDEFEFRETHRSPPQREPVRGRHEHTDIDIDININEQRAPPPRQRSQSRGQLVGRKHEEWIVRRERTPTPPPPPKDFEREEIIIRQRRERTPSPAPPPREPTPEPMPPPPPPPEPIYRPPIIQEVITHHRTIDHGVARARSPTPPPPAPLPPPPPPETKEEELQIEIRRTGTRNGKAYEDDIIFETEHKERDVRAASRQRSRSVGTRRDRSRSRDRVDNRELAIRSRSKYDDRVGSRYDDEVAAEADYYNRKVSGRGYPGEAYNGATRDWGLVDIPPGTQKVAMDGVGGGRQEITWDRYAGDRHGKFYTGDRMYEQDWGRERNGYGPPLPPPERERHRGNEEVRETRITETRITEETNRGKTKDKTWTEITKDLVIKEAIEERAYEYEETDEFFYVMEYLRYEDVLRLVETTEDIRRQRRDRIREIQWERDELERKPAPKAILPPPPMIPPPPIREARGGAYDERIVEREYYHDRHGRGGYR